MNDPSPLEASLRAADVEGALAALEAIPRSERESYRALLRRLKKEADAANRASFGDTDAPPLGRWEALRAIAIATLVCGTASEIEAAPLSHADLATYGKRFRPDSLVEYANLRLRSSPLAIAGIQELIADGAMERPTGDDYVLGVIALPRSAIDARRLSLLERIDEDPGLLAPHDGADPFLLRIFDVEGTSDCSLAAMDKYGFGALTWESTILALLARGSLRRVDVLERTIAALERDYLAFRAGWFSRFHATLAPSLDERAVHAERYVGLLRSKNPSTLTLAAEAVAALYDANHLASDEFVASLEAVLTAKAKSLVNLGLGILDRVVARDPGTKTEAIRALLVVFVSDSAELQKKAIARLESWGIPDELRAEASALAAQIVPTLRDRFAKLFGESAPARPEPPRTAKAEPRGPGVLAPLDESRRVPPIDSLAELVERVSFAFENEADVDELERCIDGIVRLAPAMRATPEPLSPVLKRMKRLSTPFGNVLAELIRAALVADSDPELRVGWVGFVLPARFPGLVRLARGDAKLAPLAAPTHRRGFLDPAVLIERLAAQHAARFESPLIEQCLAILRLPAQPGSPAQISALRALPDAPMARALRHALGDDVVLGEPRELFLAAARIRHPGTDDPKAVAAYGATGPDAAVAARITWNRSLREAGEHAYSWVDVDVGPSLDACPPERIATYRLTPEGAGLVGGRPSILHFATLFPSSLDGMLALGVPRLGNNRDWWEAQWENRTYLDLLSDPTVPMTYVARTVLALGLGAKEAGEGMAAVDVLVHAYAEGRLEPGELAASMTEVLARSLANVARWTKRLTAAARAHELGPRLVFDLVVAILSNGFEPPPKDASGLVELSLELAVANGYAVPAASRSPLAAMPLPAKGRKALDRLLALG